ncbi:MAG TPA: hypothetical protein VMW80_01130 [Candidatus Dormibacteraeota bacterium]|nr:hypothetical protein [Candidatus Dormibacteraeota bacterium]
MIARDLWIDFNDVDATAHVSSLLSHARPGVAVRVGGILFVGDDEGNRCRAQVVGIASGVVDLALEGSTFEAADDSQVSKLHV